MNEAVITELLQLLADVLAVNRKTYQMAKAMGMTAKRTDLLREEYRQQFEKTPLEQEFEAVSASLERLRAALLPTAQGQPIPEPKRAEFQTEIK